jgi:hypothetical protein
MLLDEYSRRQSRDVRAPVFQENHIERFLKELLLGGASLKSEFLELLNHGRVMVRG